MGTVLGKVLKKIRIDSDELLYNMAERLGVSSAFLSAVECGKKKMPKKWRSQIIKEYNLSEDDIMEFDKAIVETENSISLDLTGKTDYRKDFAISFARSFDDLTKEQIRRMKEIMLEEDK